MYELVHDDALPGQNDSPGDTLPCEVEKATATQSVASCDNPKAKEISSKPETKGIKHKSIKKRKANRLSQPEEDNTAMPPRQAPRKKIEPHATMVNVQLDGNNEQERIVRKPRKHEEAHQEALPSETLEEGSDKVKWGRGLPPVNSSEIIQEAKKITMRVDRKRSSVPLTAKAQPLPRRNVNVTDDVAETAKRVLRADSANLKVPHKQGSSRPEEDVVFTVRRSQRDDSPAVHRNIAAGITRVIRVDQDRDPEDSQVQVSLSDDGRHVKALESQRETVRKINPIRSKKRKDDEREEERSPKRQKHDVVSPRLLNLNQSEEEEGEYEPAGENTPRPAVVRRERISRTIFLPRERNQETEKKAQTYKWQKKKKWSKPLHSSHGGERSQDEGSMRGRQAIQQHQARQPHRRWAGRDQAKDNLPRDRQYIDYSNRHSNHHTNYYNSNRVNYSNSNRSYDNYDNSNEKGANNRNQWKQRNYNNNPKY